MNYVIGVLLSLPVMIFASRLRPGVQRWLYPLMVGVIASFYMMFAAGSGDATVMLAEASVAVGFFVLAALGFRGSIWLIVTALAAHGVFDLVHPLTVANTGVPGWWGGFCWTYDLTAAAVLAWATCRTAPRPFSAAAPATSRVTRP